MVYDEDLAARIREELEPEADVIEKKMFGGLAFMVGGNMSVAASGNGGIMLRCDPADSDGLVARGAERVVMRGKEMSNWLRVDEAGLSDDDFAYWVAVGLAYARSLPVK